MTTSGVLHKNVETAATKQEIIRGPTIQNRCYLLGRAIKHLGIARVTRRAIEKAISLGSRKRIGPGTPPSPMSELEQRFGPDPSANYPCIRSSSHRWTLPYQPSSKAVFDAALGCVSVDRSNYVFIDIGAGKGFVMLKAAEYPFKSVLGIEFSETLARVGQQNIRTYSKAPKCLDVQYVCADATQFNLPHQPSVLYLFNPFQGKLMDRMIDNITNSLRQNPRDLWIVYVNPWENRKFRRCPEFEPIESNWDFSVYRADILKAH